MENIKLGKIQFFVIVSLFTSGGAILILPSVAAHEAGNNGWISIILSILIGLAVIPLYVRLNAKFPGQSFVQYSEIILGKIVGKIVSVLFLICALLLSAALLWDVSALVSLHIMGETPIFPIELLMLIIVVMGARLGLETIARTGELLFPWAALLFIIPSFFLIPQINWDYFLPVLDEGFKPILRSSYTVTAITFVESFVLLMVMPYVSERKSIMKAFIVGAFLSGLVLLITVTSCIVVLGPDVTAAFIFPTYALAKVISIGRFVERIEAIVAGVWMITVYFKATICFFVTVFGTAQLFKLKDYRPLTIPFGFILLPLTPVIFPNIIYFRIVSAKYFPMMDYTIGLFVPFLMWMIYHMRKKKIQQGIKPSHR